MSTRYSDNYCGRYKINSLGPKGLLKTQTFGKKGKLSSEEKFLAYFSRSIEHDKYQGTIHSGPQGILRLLWKF